VDDFKCRFDHVKGFGCVIEYANEGCLSGGEFVLEVGLCCCGMETADCLYVGVGAIGVFVVVDDFDVGVVVEEDDVGVEEDVGCLFFEREVFVFLVVEMMGHVVEEGLGDGGVFCASGD
jgi:hypothetical protein